MVQIVAGIRFDSGHAGLHILSDEVLKHGDDCIRFLAGAVPVLSPIPVGCQRALSAIG